MNIIKNWIKGYNPDYKDICLYKKEFDKCSNITKLKIKVLNDLKQKNEEEIKDWSIMLNIEMEEINKINNIIATLPLLIFVFGLLANLYSDVRFWGITIITIGALTIFTYINFVNTRATQYYKYFIFLKEIINKYINEKKNKRRWYYERR